MTDSLNETLKRKIELYEDLMKDDHVLLHLDSSREGVNVPPHLANNPSLTLKLSYLFQGDITHDHESISAYLKFSGHYQLCVLPWSAIWGMTGTNGENHIWPEELPPEVVKNIALSKIAAVKEKFFPSKQSPTPKAGSAGETERGDQQVTNLREVKKSTGRKVPELKRIK